jgi:hypothetical protein
MKVTEFKGIASQQNFKVGNAVTSDLVRAIQQAEENQLCFSNSMYA